MEAFRSLDTIDRRILSELQSDGRVTLTELADRVGLSVSPCHRRLRALEQAGLIVGYRAQLDAAQVGLPFEALVFVTMRGANRKTLADFEQAVTEIVHIVDAQRLFGEPDYLLRVVAADLAAFQQIYDSALAELPGIQKLSSTLVMKRIVQNRSLPLS